MAAEDLVRAKVARAERIALSWCRGVAISRSWQTRARSRGQRGHPCRMSSRRPQVEARPERIGRSCTDPAPILDTRLHWDHLTDPVCRTLTWKTDVKDRYDPLGRVDRVRHRPATRGCERRSAGRGRVEDTRRLTLLAPDPARFESSTGTVIFLERVAGPVTVPPCE